MSTLEMKHWLAVALVLTTSILLSVTSMSKKSATVDEVPHLAAGYSYLKTGDFRMNFEHPPLIKELAAAPLLLLNPRLELTDEWNQRNEWVFGQRFLYSWNDPDRLLFWGRMPIIALFALLGLLVYFCARDFYGPTAGLVALILYAFTPDLLAHGQLVTTDLGITCFTFSAVYCFYRALQRPSLLHSGGVALSVGLAAASKYSVAILILILIALSLWHLLSASPTYRTDRLKQVGQLALITLATTWLIIWLTYGFQYSIVSSLAGQTMALNWEALETNRLNRLLQLMNHWKLLPESYLFGAAAALKMLSGRIPYFLGAINPDSWRLFYPVSFVLKTPLPLLLLIGYQAFRSIRQRIVDRRMVFLLLPVILYFTVAIASKIGIGNRHLLPIYPFLIVWVSQIGPQFAPFKLNLKTGLITMLLLWQVLGTLRIYPDFLTYFNEVAGGPKRGYFYMVDSNFDWGQDLKGLADFRKKHLEEKLYVSYFGMADPTYYLRDALYLNSYPAVALEKYVDLTEVPSNALMAISATKLMSRDLETTPASKLLVEKLRALPPEERIGYSILVFRMP